MHARVAVPIPGYPFLDSFSETVRKGVRGNAQSMDLSGIRTI
jgi:hypothetical protein